MDLDRIKRNVAKMAAQNAPIEDIDGYIASEGATLDQIRAHKAQAPDLSLGETALDVGKSAGIGLAQGAIGLATLPGNIEALGRRGVDAAARGLGFQDPETSKGQLLPTYSDVKGGIEGYTGEFYKPQSTAGEYARTIGEFAPLAFLGPGGAAARATNVVGPAVASETAGQLTEGTEYEPYARAAAGLAGGVATNVATNAARRAVTPLPVDPVRARMVQTLEDEGVTALTAGQRTGSKPLQWAESTTQDMPFAGTRAAQMMTDQGEQFTAAALRRVGVDARRAETDVIDQAFRQIGQQFDDIAARNVMMVDDPLVQQVTGAAREYRQLVPPTMRAPVIDDIIADLRPGAVIDGARYQAYRSRLDRMARGSNDPQTANALREIRNALDDGMGRWVQPADQGAWQNVRGQYRDLLVIEKAAAGAGENAATGIISPSQLRNAAKTQNTRAYVRGQSDLGNLARAGEAVMKPLPQSGTAPRAAAQNVLSIIGGFAGHGAAGAPGVIAGVAAPGMAGRALMSRPVQNYLANQAIPQQNALQMLPAYARVPPAAMLAEQYPNALMGGIGPRYDEYGNPY